MIPLALEQVIFTYPSGVTALARFRSWSRQVKAWP